MKGLPTELAEQVAAHLVATGELIGTDPELALRHAHAARRRAARLTVTREALGEAAYAAGEWSVALNEFRALRRMTGDQMWLPVMADCERALGRAPAALRLVKESESVTMRPQDRVELRLVEAGARADLGQQAEALRLLRQTLSALPGRATGARVRVGYALADLLLSEGHTEDARRQFREVATWDTDGETDADERSDALSGFVLEVGDDEPEESAEMDGPDETDEAPVGDGPTSRTEDSAATGAIRTEENNT